jgi:hypothetical protein
MIKSLFNYSLYSHYRNWKFQGVTRKPAHKPVFLPSPSMARPDVMRAPCHVSFGFFSGFFEIRLAELQIDPQLESTTRPKARGLHSIWNPILWIAFSIWTRVLLKTFESSTRGRLETTREDLKNIQGSAGVHPLAYIHSWSPLPITCAVKSKGFTLDVCAPFKASMAKHL